MQLWIRQTGGDEAPRFSVSDGKKETTPVALPSPAERPIEGYPKKTLLQELPWYLEQYLDFPDGADEQLADAIVSTLQAWGREMFDKLFLSHAYAWYDKARRNLDELEIKIVSNSPEVLSWPWEALYSGDDGYLAQHCYMEREPPDLPEPNVKPPKKTDELHILFIVSRPDKEHKVGYHGLEREVIRYVRENRLAVTMDLLRPPTFERLREVLEERPGYYHIVHFDGHGGYGPAQAKTETDAPKTEEQTILAFPSLVEEPAKYQAVEGQLVFEKARPDENGNDKEFVGADELGNLLRDHGVPMMALNACQSAMIDNQAKDPFASVAARLLKAGIPSVVAMGYSLYLSGARQFVPAFYKALFRNGNPAGAIRAGRQAMKHHPGRPCYYGECPLQDWIVPELTEINFQKLPL